MRLVNNARSTIALQPELAKQQELDTNIPKISQVIGLDPSHPDDYFRSDEPTAEASIPPNSIPDSSPVPSTVLNALTPPRLYQRKMP